MSVPARLDWRKIRAFATAEAEKLGHKLEPWTNHTRPHHPLKMAIKMAMCAICYGCCWMDFVSPRGYRCGGRLLKYKCGTHEAAGTLHSENCNTNRLRSTEPDAAVCNCYVAPVPIVAVAAPVPGGRE